MTDREIMQQALDALERYQVKRQDFDRFADEITALTERLAHCDRCGKKLGGKGDIHTCTPLIGCVQHDCAKCKARLAQPEQEPVLWRNAAIRVGEELSSVGPDGYYGMTAQQWLDWAMEQQPVGKTSLAQPNEFNPDWDAMAVMVEEQQRMAKRIEELEAMLERQTARIVDLQTHIENLTGEE